MNGAREDWYAEARAYALAFSFDPEPEATLLTEAFARSGIRPPARLLEPMAGTGRLFPPLARRGFEVFGFDRAQGMLAAADPAVRRRLFRAEAGRFRLASSHFDGAFCLIDSFRYLLEDDEVSGFFDGLSSALRVGGLLLLGLEVAGEAPVADESWTVERSGERAVVRVRSHGRAGPRRQWMEARVEITGPEGRRTVVSRTPQRIWTGSDLEELLAARSEFRRVGLWFRTRDLSSPLADWPRSGASVICALERRPL